MEKNSTTQDILDTIEFEIAQGMLSQQSFGPAIEAVRQFENRLREETFKTVKLNHPLREIIARQFQTIDMLLAVVQEMALRIQALQNALANLAPPAGAVDDASQTIPAAQAGKQPSITASGMFTAHTPPAPIEADKQLVHAMRPETISVPLQARPIRWPLIGKLLTRLRIFYQRPAVHYTALLSERQAPVNRLLGEHILRLEALLQEQQQQIHALQTALTAERNDE